MKISCPTCSAKYSIADEKVQNRLAKIRCRKCGTAIVIDGNVSPASVYAAEGGGGSADAELAAPAATASSYAAAPVQPASAVGGVTYTVDLGENDQRQMTTKDLVDAYNTGAVTAETYVWTDGFADWTPLGQVEALVAALHAAATAGGVVSSPVDEASAIGASTHVEERPWNSGPARAAAPTPGMGGADLFGGVSDAGSESDGVSVGTAANPFSGATTGARNESSVLFSLSALTSGTGSSRSSAPPPSAASASNDDSGLIDLKALTAMAQAVPAIPTAPMPVSAVSPFVGASPLGGVSPLATPSYVGGAKGSIPAPKSGNTGLIIGISIIVAAVAVAAIVTFGGNEEQPVAPPVPALTAAPIATPPPAPAPTPTEAATGDSEAKPPATGTEETEAAPAVKKKTTTSTGKAKSSSSSSPSPDPAASPSPAPSPKPKSSGGGKCGCRSDDLMCLMNCAK